jgi:hypothetical protein
MPSVVFWRSESVTHFVLAEIAYPSLRLGVLRTLKGPLSARRTRRLSGPARATFSGSKPITGNEDSSANEPLAHRGPPPLGRELKS